MYRRWLGLILLVLSLIASVVIATNVKTTVFHRKEEYARTDEDVELEDQIVKVPPWNSTEGWVGFNATLSHKGKVDYEAYGQILPADLDREPKMVMRVVNETGAAVLKAMGFDEYVWEDTKVYAAAYLDENRLYDNFRFVDVDDSSKYVFLFRGLKNETQSRPILINLKEAWNEPTTIALLEPTAPNILIFVVIPAIVGLALVARKPKTPRKKPLQKRPLR